MIGRGADVKWLVRYGTTEEAAVRDGVTRRLGKMQEATISG